MWHICLILCTGLLHVYADNFTCDTKFTFQPACLDADHGVPIQTHSNIASAIVCSELCFENQDCRSVQFNPDNKQCLTNARRMTSVSTLCHNPIRYGYIQKSACRPYWMFDPCSPNGECIVDNSACRNGKCECEDGHAYDYRFDSCVTECAEYGDSFHEVSYTISGYNDQISTNMTTLEQCQNLCLASQGFVCRYVEFNENRNICYLSKESAFTVANSVNLSYGNFPNWRFFDRNCA